MKCENIREVWDSRLSTAVPQIDRRSGTWVVNIYSKVNPDFDGSNEAMPLESFDTGIKATANDEYDKEKLLPCYEWMLTVRDRYAHENIEKMKPAVKLINEANEKLALMGKV